MQELFLKERIFIHFYGFLKKIDLTNSCAEIQNLILQYFKTVEEKQIKQILIFVTDEYLIKKIGYEWTNFLLEDLFFNTSCGGKVFFDNLDEFIKQQDIEMIRLYLFAIKIGFKGNKNNPMDKYAETIKNFIILEKKSDINIPFKSFNQIYGNTNFTYVVLLGLIIYVGINIFEAVNIKFISKDLSETFQVINEGI